MYEEVLRSHVRPDTDWLDLGCGHDLLTPWRREAAKELARRCSGVVGIDYDLNSLKRHSAITKRVRGDITSLPFRDCSFDLATANMVVEHLADPQAQFREVARVLTPNSIYLLHTPNVLGYTTVLARILPDWIKRKVVRVIEGRVHEDVFPTYYRANSERRLRELASDSGFALLEVRMIVSSAELAVIVPLAVLELLWIRLLMSKWCRPSRTSILAIMKKA